MMKERYSLPEDLSIPGDRELTLPVLGAIGGEIDLSGASLFMVKAWDDLVEVANQARAFSRWISNRKCEYSPMTAIEFHKLFLRFQLERATEQDWGRWVFGHLMTAAQFYDLNRIELVEEPA